jgi:hypothetical protein
MSRFRCHNFPLGKTRLRESAATLAAWARAHRFFIRASLPDGSRRAAFVCGQNTDTLAAWARAHRFFIRASLPDGSRRAAFVCGQNTANSRPG